MKFNLLVFNLLVFGLVIFASSLAYGQDPIQQMIRNDQEARNAAHNARVNGLAAAAKANTARRQDVQYRSIVRDGTEIWNESDGILSSIRAWKAGVYSKEGALCRAKDGKVTIITKDGDVFNERISKLSEDCKNYVKVWKDFEKLGKKRRDEWVKEYHEKVKAEKLAAAEAAKKKIEEEQERKREIKRKEQELRDLKNGLELTDFKTLKAAYDEIEIDKTTYAEALGLLGDKHEMTSSWRKDSRGEIGSMRWTGRNPDSNELSRLRITFKNRVVSAIEWEKTSQRRRR